MIRRSSTLFLLLLPIACTSPTAVTPDGNPLRSGEPVAGVILSISEAVYSHGDDASVRLFNTSSGEIGYNTCTAARERLSGGDWVRIAPLRACTAAIYPLAAGDRIEFEEPISAEWEAGRYRMVLPVHIPMGAAPRYVTSPSFDVYRAP